MLLQELYHLAQKLEEADALPPAYHKAQKISWYIELGLDGSFKGITSVDKENAQQLAPYLKRARKSVALLLVDKVNYVLGAELEEYCLDAQTAALRPAPEQDPARATNNAERLTLFREQVEALITFVERRQSPHQEHLNAVLTFLNNEEARQQALAQLLATESKASSGDIMAFRVDGVLVHRLAQVRTFWAQAQDDINSESSNRKGLCMLTGEYGAIARIHPTEVRLGPNPANLISANERAFESYGLSQSEVAPLGLGPARLYGEALKYLITTKSHAYRLGDVTYLFWRKSLSDPQVPTLLQSPDDLFADLFSEQPTLNEQDIKHELKRIFAGGLSAIEQLDEDVFYGAAISSNSSRLVVRDTLTRSVPQVIDQLAQWFERQALVDIFHPQRRIKPLSVFALIESTCRDTNKEIQARQVPGLISAALSGSKLPLDLLQRALRRAAADPKHRITPARAVLIKIILNDHLPQGALVQPDLNIEDKRPAYLCGRLFAILEGAQYSAIQGINATIADRFYGTASTAPAMVFPRLVRGAQAHLQKLRKEKPGTHNSIQRDIEAVMSGLSEFPRTLTLLEQGLFAMGYYHQRAHIQRRIAEYKKNQSQDEQEAQ